MTSSVSNYNGTNVTRLHVSQLGSNQSSCSLSSPLIEDADTKKYTVSLERFYLHAHIPIFGANTKVFEIITQGGGRIAGDPVDVAEDHEICIVGPVYNFLDFCQQVQVFCERYNSIEAAARLNVSGYMASKKVFALDGNEAFWSNRFIRFENTFGRMWEVKGTENCYHERLSGDGFNHHAPVIRMGEPLLGTGEDADSVYYDDPYILVSHHLFNPLWNTHYPTPNVTVSFKNRSDFFENRIAIRIDSVIPVPFETFAVGTSKVDNTAAGSTRHSFFEVDFPQETVSNALTTHTNRVSDTFDIKQDLQSGVFELVANGSNTLSKTMNPGQLQTHRFEILLVRKEIDENRKITFKAEPLVFKSGDFFMLSVLFAKQV